MPRGKWWARSPEASPTTVGFTSSKDTRSPPLGRAAVIFTSERSFRHAVQVAASLGFSAPHRGHFMSWVDYGRFYGNIQVQTVTATIAATRSPTSADGIAWRVRFTPTAPK